MLRNTRTRGLLPILRSLSVQRRLEGEPPFKLSSGAESDVYVDVRKTVLDPLGATTYAMEAVQATRSLGPDLVAGVALGGCPLATAYSVYAYQNRGGFSVAPAVQKGGRGHFPVLYVRKEAKGHGTGQLIEGSYKPGQTVLLLEDVVTSGKSTLLAIRALREAGLVVTRVLTVIDREEGGADKIRASEVDFQHLYTMAEVLG